MAQFDFTFVTYADMPDLDPDDILAKDELTERGFRCSGAVWNDPEVDWWRSKVVVLRSAWDYHLHLEQFQSWLSQLESKTRVVNQPSLVRWNMHKSYLKTLSAAGLPIVPTSWFEQHSAPDLTALLAEHTQVVVKPAVGLATYGVLHLKQMNDECSAHLKRLSEQGEVMVQPFVPSVTTYGERALVFFSGVFSHAVRKTAFQPMAHAGGAGEEAVTATPEEIELGRQALALLSTVPVYARVDMVPNQDGEPMVMELELIEPSLFLGFSPGAPQRFADALCEQIRPR